MIKEIVEFTEALPPETFIKNLQLKEGLYLFLDIQEENGEVVLKNVDEDGKLLSEDFGVYTKKTEMNPFFDNCKEKTSFIEPVSSNKAWNRKFFGVSCNPFSLCFKKELYDKEDRHNEEDFNSSIKDYFKNSRKYHESTDIDLICNFESYLHMNLWNFLLNFEMFRDLGKKTVFIFLKNINIQTFKKPYINYLSKNIFNKDDYNEKIEDEIYGISDSLSGFNDKKRFLKHQTSALKYNYRISGAEAQSLWKFFKLQQNKQLPNPCPVFVDEDELNRGLISFHQDGELNSYSEMIKKLIQKYNKESLQNFYLIFFQGIKGSRIADIDFVPQFKFKLDAEVRLFEVFPLGGKFSKHQLKNIFQLQFLVFNRIFNGKLCPSESWLRYFDDIEPDPKYHFTDAICNLMMQYRKAIYDYIYKAKYESITCKMFDQMMKTSILEDIRIDDFNRGDSIKEKLNLWFSLYNFFNQNKNRENMASRIPELLEKMKQVANGENVSFSDDPAEFAFGAGQVVYFLLTKSASSNKTYAMLEPYLQKSKVSQLQESIGKTIAIYKHEIDISKGRFEKLASEVLVYNSDINMKDYLRYFLAGCFASSVIYEKKKIDENQEINN